MIAAGASEGFLLTSNGAFVTTVRVHDVDGNNPPLNTALLTEGTHQLKVIDTVGAEGIVNLTIPQRQLSATPAVAQPGDIVTVTGQRFIAGNPDGFHMQCHLPESGSCPDDPLLAASCLGCF